MTFDEDKEIQVLNGRWGPYIAYRDRNIRIPKDRDPKSFTLDEIHKLAESTPVSAKKKSGFKRQPFTVAKKQPYTVAKKQPYTVAKKQPVKAAKKQPVKAAKKRPVKAKK